jgi:ornithine carbamoyltransferase
MTSNAYALRQDAPAAPMPNPVPAPLPTSLYGRDLCSIRDLSPDEVHLILDTALQVKAQPQKYRHALDARQMVLFFEKESLRTRLTFEAGINTLGGSAIFVDQTASRLGQREPLVDVAHNLERWVDVIVLRTYAHETITGMAEHAGVPVINALSDIEHPCQSLADMLTLQERFGDLRGLRLAYLGDGNNVAHSLMLTAAQLGMHCTLATPPQYGPAPEYLAAARSIAANTGGKLEWVHDPRKAVAGADAIYTDVWTSMGREHEAEQRNRACQPYQVNQQIMALAAPHAVFMHCLPARRGDEVTAEVFDGPQSIVFDQAENRLHAQKAILLLLLGSAPEESGENAHAGHSKTLSVNGTRKRVPVPTFS